jgi:hypothetical protein
MPDPTLTFDHQASIRTKAGVGLGFRVPESSPGAPVRAWLLEAVYRSLSEPAARGAS